MKTLSKIYKTWLKTLRFMYLEFRLGDLGAIDKKYDVAVSTACSSLNTVLVDTAETGKACIEYLRR